jgi:glutathione transport system substrate-binding protein
MKKIQNKGYLGTCTILLLSLLFFSTSPSEERSFPFIRPVGVQLKYISAGDQSNPERLPKLVVAQQFDATTMDAHYVTDSVTASIMEHMVETLLERTPEGEIAPKLVESWKVSSDATEFTLKLRKGIKFHDGQPFNAEAVKVNFDRRLNPRTSTKFNFLVAQIASVNAVDEYTVKIKTKMPFAPLLSHLTYTTNGMQSPATLKRSWDNPLIMPIGTGPFIFKEWVPGNRVSMVQNEAYWGIKPALSEVVFRAMPDDATRVAALEKGAVQVAAQIPPSDFIRLKENKTITVLQTPSVKTIFIGFNCLKEPYTDKRVRQALNYAVNKEAIVKQLLGGMGRISDAPISPGIFGYTPIKTYEYDIGKAKALLAEAGYPEGFETTLYCTEGRYYMDSGVAKVVTADLRKIGVKVEIKMMAWETYLSLLFGENDGAGYGIYMLGWSCVTGDADYGLYLLFHSKEWPKRGINASFFKNEQLDQLLDAARSTARSDNRKKLYQEAMRLIVEEAPWIFLYSEMQLTGISTNVKDVIVHPIKSINVKQARVE